MNPPFSALWSFFADFGSCPRNTTAVGGDNAGDECVHWHSYVGIWSPDEKSGNVFLMWWGRNVKNAALGYDLLCQPSRLQHFIPLEAFFQGGSSSCNGLLLPKVDSESEESCENKTATNSCKERLWKLKVHNLYVSRWTLLSGSFSDILNYTLKSLFLLVLWQLYAGHAKHPYNWCIQACSLSCRPWHYWTSGMTSELLSPPAVVDSLWPWVFW